MTVCPLWELHVPSFALGGVAVMVCVAMTFTVALALMAKRRTDETEGTDAA